MLFWSSTRDDFIELNKTLYLKRIINHREKKKIRFYNKSLMVTLIKTKIVTVPFLAAKLLATVSYSLR